MKPLRIVLILGFVTASSFAARSQPVSNPPQQPPQASAPSQEVSKSYLPGLGEFMGRIQADHAKLWLAGEARNWELAGYELGELKEVFSDVQDFVPRYQNVPVGQMIDCNHHWYNHRSGRRNRNAQFQQVLRVLRQADRSLQFLPSGCKSSLHCHPTTDAIEFQQSGLLANEEMRLRGLAEHSHEHSDAHNWTFPD
jgi:hypothetical protein